MLYLVFIICVTFTGTWKPIKVQNEISEVDLKFDVGLRCSCFHKSNGNCFIEIIPNKDDEFSRQCCLQSCDDFCKKKECPLRFQL
eukprot:UN03633